jgi:hypothetical protein
MRSGNLPHAIQYSANFHSGRDLYSVRWCQIMLAQFPIIAHHWFASLDKVQLGINSLASAFRPTTSAVLTGHTLR